MIHKTSTWKTLPENLGYSSLLNFQQSSEKVFMYFRWNKNRKKQEHKELFNFFKDSTLTLCVVIFWPSSYLFFFLRNDGKSKGCILPVIHWFPSNFPPISQDHETTPVLLWDFKNTWLSAFQWVYNLAVEIRLTVIWGLVIITPTFREEIFCGKRPKNVSVLKVRGWILWVGNERKQRKKSAQKGNSIWVGP